MSGKPVKLTSSLLRKIVQEEVSKFGDMEDTQKVAKDTDEVDADEIADSLEKKIDYVKALKIEEARLVKRIMKIRENRSRVMRSIRSRKTV